MPTGQMTQALQYLRRAVLWRDGAGLSDAQLLEHFIERRDEAAFETLVRRHGPMVLGVCRRLLRNEYDADDAFQATFLVLVRKAASIAPKDMVGNWLYGVAYQTALKGRAVGAKRRMRERQLTPMCEPETKSHDRWDDLQSVLDQELSRLPGKYRFPFVLCDLEGKSYKEAARQLGWPEGTLSVRLARARKMLAKRLTRHGFAITGAALAAAVSKNAASAYVPPSVVSSTIKAAGLCAAGQMAAAGVVTAKVAVLTEGVLKTMLVTKIKAVMAVFITISIISIGGGALSYSLLAGERSEQKGGQENTSAAAKEVSAAVTERDSAETDKEKLQGIWKLVRLEEDGQSFRGAKFRETGNLGIDGDRLFDPDFDEPEWTWHGTFKLDTSKNPKRITIIDEGPQGELKFNGIYSLDGDDLRICINEDGTDTAIPTEFKTKKGSPFMFVTFRREKPADAHKKKEQPNAGGVPAAKQVDNGANNKAAQTDKDKLQGVWNLVRLEALGKVFGADMLSAVGDLGIRGNRLYNLNPYAPGMYALTNTDETKGSYGLLVRRWHGTFELDSSKKPKCITIRDDDGAYTQVKTFNGIYALDGDELRLCLSADGTGAEIPREFKTEIRSGLVLATFKREQSAEAQRKFERFYAGGFQSVRGFEFRGSDLADEDQLLGEWVGKDPDGVSFTLIFGPKSYSEFDAEDGRHFQGTYSMNLKQTPPHLDFHWTMPFGRFKTGEFRTIMELKNTGELRLELTAENKPRPKEFTANSALMVLRRPIVESKDASKSDKVNMQGRWQLVDGAVDGEKIDVAGFDGVNVHDNIMNLPFGEVSPVSFKLDTTKKPKQITLIIKSLGTDAKINGIYWLDGDDLQFCFADKGEDRAPPKDFVSKPGSGHKLFILKRLKPPSVEKKQSKANVPGLDSPVALDFGFPIIKPQTDYKRPFKNGGDFIFLNSLEYQIPIKANDQQQFKFWTGFFGH